MKKPSRRYQEIKSQIPTGKYFSLSECLNFLQQNNRERSKKIKVSFALNLTKKKINLSSKITLPYPIVPKKNLVLLRDNLPENIIKNLPKNNNVELLTVEELQEKITTKKSRWGFEKLLVHPQSEFKIKPLEKILVSKGFYPSKKNGNLTENINEEIAKFQSGEKVVKSDKTGNVNLIIGKSDFSLEKLETNYKSVYNKIMELRPSGWKEKFFNSITLSTTMGPGIKCF